jgi:hypothetical protein
MSKRVLHTTRAVAILALAASAVAPVTARAQSSVGVGPTGPALSTPPGSFRPGSRFTGPALSSDRNVTPGLGPTGPALSTPPGTTNPRFAPRGPALSEPFPNPSTPSRFDTPSRSRFNSGARFDTFSSRMHPQQHVQHAPRPRHH